MLFCVFCLFHLLSFGFAFIYFWSCFVCFRSVWFRLILFVLFILVWFCMSFLLSISFICFVLFCFVCFRLAWFCLVVPGFVCFHLFCSYSFDFASVCWLLFGAYWLFYLVYFCFLYFIVFFFFYYYYIKEIQNMFRNKYRFIYIYYSNAVSKQYIDLLCLFLMLR